MRITAIGMALLFGFAAILQWNDPDPLRWIALYGLAVGVALGVSLGRSWSVLEWVALIVFAAVTLALLPAALDARSEAFTSFHMQSSEDERVRELGGAALGLLWCVAVRIWRRRVARSLPK